LTTIRTRDIVLQPFTAEDVDQQYYNWLQDEEIVRYLDVARKDRSPEALLEYVNQISNSPDNFFFKICLKDSMAKIGTISLALHRIHNTASYGYIIGERDYWGGTWALQAQIGLFDYAFDNLSLRKIIGGAVTSNVGSIFNFNRLGLEREGIRRSHCLVGMDGNEVCDYADYGCLVEGWAAISEKFQNLRNP